MTDRPATPPDTGTASRVWTAMLEFVTGQDRWRALRAALDLGPGKAEVLIKLVGGPMTLREIARAVEVDPPAATVGVDLLEARGLVHRTPHPDDNRRKLVHLTDAGRDAARRAHAILTEPPPALASLDPGDLARLDEILARLRAGSRPLRSQATGRAPAAAPGPQPPDPQVEGVTAMPANPLGVALRGRRAGHHTLAWAQPGLQAPENFTLASPAFSHGGPIPDKHRGRLRGAHISPALTWTQPPAGTAELILIVQDPDVPFGKPATHALTLGIDPALTGLPENALTSPSPVPGLQHGKGPLGRRGWTGPMPIRSHGPHSYVFQLFALDQAPALAAGFTLNEAIAAISGHAIGRARLDGTYEIR